ncbi:MAG: HPr family phosphocarrier protein [Marinovum algicola]|jgi:phosphocarrier protein HPr|uniref:Phosphocarrier protein n=1 Tax=Marinovum algicola TaxID=42444 RepID=A0A975ZN21_9RHOB|nr:MULTISPECIES: HPr family phosphocarrier protein [Marinovum]AKO98069.1 Phosphotransferase System HPr (HPr) Family [Marinovum algicola DG 898]MDD9741982.1 HPr family phosphocarrier protein [Marinovum sp. SP66]MDD9746718.1 HPr family phosphocarrier protein [Marinovum sp. PR37]SEJ33903.1 phosphocarrier protein [Marinovum algicola]SLN38267.1 Phosphocarrier protein NPr [Marinovum algicola]
MTDTVTRTLKIVNEKGLHARASAKLVEVVEGFDARAEVSRDGLDASGDSIMGLLMLAASKGSTIEVQTSGPDAEALADAVEALVADRFGEDC